MRKYKLYGFTVESEIDLGYPPIDDAQSDISISLSTAIMPEDFPEQLLGNCFEDSYQRIHWPFLGSAEIFSSRRVVLTPKKGIDYSIFAFAIIGPVVALILHQRHFFTLHASSIAVDGRAVAFMGDKGAGKSTMAAALVAQGKQLIADDITAILDHGDHYTSNYGYPLMKLAATTLGAFPQLADQQTATTMSPIGDKHILKLRADTGASSPLSGLFILKRGETSCLNRLSIDDAFNNIMRYSYPIRFGADVLNITSSKLFLSQAAQIASRVPVYELISAPGLDLLPEAIALVEQAIHYDQ